MIRLQTLGAVDLRRDGTEVRSVLAQPKRLALLTCLATASGGFTSRETLLGLFWPEQDDERARNALRQALHYLRKSLGNDVFVSRGEHEIGIDPDVLACDAAAFDAAIAAGRLEEALERYRGDFLPGFFLDDLPDAERWLEEARAGRCRRAVDAALRLAVAAEASGDLRDAAGWARRAGTLVPHEETPIRLLVRVLDRAGEAAAAIVAYGEFEKRLAQEYGLEPSAELRRDVERLRHQATSQSSPPGVPVTPVTATTPAAASTPTALVTTHPVAGPAVARWRPPVPLMIGALVLVSVAAGWFAASRRSPSSAASDPPPAIAVLPFVNLSAGADSDYFSDGITEEILNELTRIVGLRVAARTSSFAFKGRSLPIDSIGRALHVSHILEGTVRRTEDRLKITVQLVDAKDGFHHWSDAYDRELKDVFAVQEDIARSIANALEIRLAVRHAAAKPRTTSTEAYDLYLRGRHMISTVSEERNRDAVRSFERALELDPRFAAAHAGLARALIGMGEFVPPTGVLPRARATALRALELDSTLVDTRLVLADVRRVLDRDWNAAELELRRALQLDPMSGQAHNAYARFLADSRRFADARRELGKAWEIWAAEAPDSLLATFRRDRHISWGNYHLFIGQPADALALAHTAVTLDPTGVTGYWLEAIALLKLGQFDGAVAGLERIRDMTGGATPFLAQLGYAYGRAAKPVEARTILHELETRAATRYLPKDQIAFVHLGLGAPDSAIAWLHRAVDDYHWWMPNTNAHPLWSELHGDPRFRALMRSIGAP